LGAQSLQVDGNRHITSASMFIALARTEGGT
jgi:hypothetical protein